jgi:hypothetical protein
MRIEPLPTSEGFEVICWGREHADDKMAKLDCSLLI